MDSEPVFVPDAAAVAALRERWAGLTLTELAPFLESPSDVDRIIARLTAAVLPAGGLASATVRHGAGELGRWLAEQRVPLDVAARLVAALGAALADLWQDANGAAHTMAARGPVLIAGLVGEAMRVQAELAVELAQRAAAEPVSPDDEVTRRRLAELDAIQRVTTATSTSPDLDETLHQAVDSVASVTRADICSIYLFEPESGVLVLSASTGFPAELVGRVRLRLGEGVTGAAAEEGRVIALRDAWNDPRFKQFPWLDEHPYRSMASVPIYLHNQQHLIGVLNLQTRDYRDYPAEEIRFLETVARQVGLAIENARLYVQTDERLRQKLNELTTLIRVSSAITSTLDVQQVLDLIAGQTVVLTGMDMAGIFELDESTASLTISASYGLSQEFVESVRVPVGEATAGLTVQTGRPVRVANIFESEYSSVWRGRAEEEGYRAVVGVPLVSHRRVLGALLAYSREAREIPDDMVDLLLAFATEAAIAIDNARLYQEARRALATKSALLQEMHHRVKNNLQTVAALLSLQARRTNVEAAQPLRDSVARIESIAAVHDLLSQDSIGSTTLEALARQIIEVASASLIAPGKRVTFGIEGGPVRFASKEATVLALLLNELVANAVLHGFAHRRGGHIVIGAEAVNGGAVHIYVRDNGSGLPPGFTVEKDRGLGVQICQTLVTTDLRGAFTIEDHGGGTTATIKLRRSDAIALS